MSESLVGAYVVLQIDAKAMVAGYADAPISAVARALGTGRYVALVEREVQVPTRSDSDAREWRVYQVSFVGRHSYSQCEASHPLRAHNCVPIFPATLNSDTDVAVRSSRPLPLPECCHRPSIEALVRINPQPYQDPPVLTLSRDQVQRLVKSRKANTSQPSTPIPASSYLSPLRPEPLTPSPRARYETSLLPRNHSRDLSGTASPALSALADLALTPSPTSQDFFFQGNTSPTRNSSPSPARLLLPPRLTTPVSDITARSETSVPVSALFERARTRHETLDSASVYSTTSTARSSLAAGGPADAKENPESEDASASVSELALGPEVDLDEVPLVDVTFDLGELEDVPDPKGFSEERGVVVQLVQKAKERRGNDASSRVLTPEPAAATGADADAMGPSTPNGEGEWRRLSMMRVRSRQSTNTVPSSANSLTGRTRNKLRRARSHSHSLSYSRLQSRAQSPSRSRSRSRSRQPDVRPECDDFGYAYRSVQDVDVVLQAPPRKLVKRKSMDPGDRSGKQTGVSGPEAKTLPLHSAPGAVKGPSRGVFRRLGRLLRSVTTRVVVRLGLQKTRKTKTKTGRSKSVRGRSRSRSRESDHVAKL